MSHQKGDDVEHLREENIMKYVEDDMDIQPINREKNYFDYDEDYFLVSNIFLSMFLQIFMFMN